MECDEGVLRTLGPLLGFSAPSTAQRSGDKRKGKPDVTPPSSQRGGDASRKKKTKAKGQKKQTATEDKEQQQEENKAPVRKSKRLAK